MNSPSCDDCVTRIYGSTSYMADEQIQIQLIADLLRDGVCDEYSPDDVETCSTALELVIPAALNMFAAADVQWAVDFCSVSMGCM